MFLIFRMSELKAYTHREEARDGNKARIRDRAILAAIYEDCIQAFLQLTSAVEANLDWKQTVQSLNDSYSRLSEWGHETGASSRQLELSLDYSLRKSTRLHTKTAELLGELHSALREGKSFI